MKCLTCETEFVFNEPVTITNNDGTTTISIENVVVLIINKAGTDFEPRFFCRSLCASEWADRKGVRLTRPLTFPARYYEAIEEEPDISLRPMVQDQKHTGQAQKLPRSRLS